MFSGRAVLQKRIMALLRKIEHSTLGNAQVLLLLSYHLTLTLIRYFHVFSHVNASGVKF